MNNPFLRNKQQNQNTQQAAPVLNQNQAYQPSMAPVYPAATPFTPAAYSPVTNNALNKMPPPPPTVSEITSQLGNVNLSAPPTDAAPPQQATASSGSYLTTKGRYQLPANAYQYASAAATESNNNAYYSAENGTVAPDITPAYLGTANTFDASSPAPAATDPAALPDEEYVKLSYEVAPNSPSLENMSGMPFGAVFHPLASDGSEIPVVSFGAIGVQRCRRCRLYINPFVQFVDGGRRWKCNMCGYVNDVPNEYFCHLDMNGRRADLASRSELLKGQVEFEAGSEYCLRPPQFPSYLFVIDASYQAVASGMLSTVCTAISNSLDALIESCGNSTVNCGFITFDSSIHFYQLDATKGPRQLVVGEVEEVFLPIPSSLLINITDHKQVVVDFLKQLPLCHQDNKNVDTCTGNAMQFAAKLMEDVGGKILLFQTSMPSCGIGKLKLRETVNVLGTEAEKDLLNPSTPFYEELAKILVDKQMSVDVFLGAAQYADIATLSTLSHFTGGQFYYYPSFQSDSNQAEALYGDIYHNLTRETAFESVFRVRVPQGAKVDSFSGCFTLSNTDLMVAPVVHADSVFTLEFKLENVLSMPCFPIQSALLYTNNRGERRIRVHTVSIPISNVLNHLYERVNEDVITSLVISESLKNVGLVGPSTTRQKIHQSCITLIKRFKAQETTYNGPQQAIPEKIHFIPLYMMAMQKCGAFRGGCDNKSDLRSYALQQLSVSSVNLLLRVLYPTLMVLSNMSEEACTTVEDPDTLDDSIRVYGEHNMILPPLLNLSLNSLSGDGIYLIDDGFSFWLLLGSQANSSEITDLFGVPSLDGYDVTNLRLPVLDTVLNEKLHLLLQELRVDRPYYCPLRIVRPTDPEFGKVKWRLIEDRDVFPGGNYSFIEYEQLVTGIERKY